MKTLTIMIGEITEQDYDGVDETVKEVCGSIDGVKLSETMTEETTVSDANCKTNYKAFLTALDYTWDNEA